MLVVPASLQVVTEDLDRSLLARPKNAHAVIEDLVLKVFECTIEPKGVNVF